jgi:hypothetical protein
MGTVSNIVKQLKKERDLVQKQLSGLNAAISAFAGVYSGAKSTRKPRKLSAKAKANMAAAQRARRAKEVRVKKKSSSFSGTTQIAAMQLSSSA